MGKSIVKIQRSDIKEMVTSCVSSVLSEAFSLTQNLRRDIMKRGDEIWYIYRLNNKYGFASDDFDWAKKHCALPELLEAIVSKAKINLISYDQARKKYANREQLKDDSILDKKLMGSIQKAGYNGMAFYPNSKVTCVIFFADSSKSPFMTNKRPVLDNPDNQIDKASEVVKRIFPHGSGDMSLVEINNFSLKVNGHQAGELGIIKAPNRKAIEQYLHNSFAFKQMNKYKYNEITSKIDMDAPTLFITPHIDSEWQNRGVFTKLMDTVVSDYRGTNYHFLFRFHKDYSDFTSIGEHTLLFDKIMAKYGLEPIYEDDLESIYYQ